jgi:uncharacterized coiled-coil protein SlyX
MNNQKIVLNIGIIVVFVGIFAISNLMPQVQGQPQQLSPLTVEELEAAQASLDQAIQALQDNNMTQTLQQIDRTEDQLDIAEDKLERQLGFD